MLRAIGVTAAVVTVLGLTACSDSSDEPTGLASESGSPEPTETSNGSDTPTPTEAPSGNAENETGAESDPTPADNTFTQPYLPQERVVELRDSIPVEPPADATDEELAVIDSFAHAQGAWEQILWGVPPEDTDLEAYSTGGHLSSIRDYAEESRDRERVSIGPPKKLHLRTVNVQGDSAEVGFCADTSGWSDYFAGGAPQPDDQLYNGTATLELADGTWKTNEVDYLDDLTPCEGVFP